MTTIIPVVEGAGDVAAFPVLLRLILQQMYNRPDIIVAQGNMVVRANGRQNLENKLEKFLGHAQNKPECDAILVLLDTDGECPVELAQRLLQRCEEIGLIRPVEIVCAHWTFESWFLASLETIKGQRGISEAAALSLDAEDIQNPKQWLTNHMPDGQAYKETLHQASLSSFIDIELTYHNSRSFRRLCHALELLLDRTSSPTT